MKYIFLLGLLVFPVIISTFTPGSLFVNAVEDEIDDDVNVEGEGEENTVVEETDDDSKKPGGSPDIETTILFTKPVFPSSNTQLDLPAGNVIEFLVGFSNKGKQDFTIDTLDASLRYPMDFNYFIQNFSTIIYNRVVKPGHEATLGYSFIPAEAIAGRPFGLSVNLQYRDEHNFYYEGIFNETVNIIELDEGFDGETFFLYVFLGACVVLLLVIGQHFLVSVGKKRVGTSQSKKQQVETGTKNSKDIDYDWIPKESLNTLKSLTNSPKSPKGKAQSPRQRKTKRTIGDD